MQFKNGYLGAFLVVIAVVMTIAGSYVMSLDMEEKTVTKYRDSADLTGLFNAEEAPSFMPFNPSENQTGYYTDRTNKYFDGVDATITLQPNKYLLNMEPIATTSASEYGLDSLSTEGGYHFEVWYWTDNSTRNQVSQVNYMTLTSLATALNLSTYTKIDITAAHTPIYTSTDQFITITTVDKISGGNFIQPKIVKLKNPNLTGELDVSLGLTNDASTIDNPIMAVSWDSRNAYATLYYDIDMKNPAGVASPTDVCILWGGYNIITGWTFGDEIDYDAATFPDNQYMVIADGVKLEDVA